MISHVMIHGIARTILVSYTIIEDSYLIMHIVFQILYYLCIMFLFLNLWNFIFPSIFDTFFTRYTSLIALSEKTRALSQYFCDNVIIANL